MIASGSTSVRKRVISTGGDSVASAPRKRPRISTISADFQVHLLGGTPTVSSGPDRLPQSRSLYSDESYLHAISHLTRPLSGTSSFTAASRAGSPGGSDLHSEGSAFISRSGMALMRSVSSASLRSSSPTVPSYPESSAKYYLRNTKVTIDFSVPSIEETRLLSCSSQNILFFSRGNRIHYKNMTTTEEVGQLCKLQESHGDIRLIECGGVNLPDMVALGTSKGFIHLWDVKLKKMTASWSTKGVTAMGWNGPVLSLGGMKGTIRHYDTRINPTSKMKEQARKVTRHQTRISSLTWNVDGKVLASGDESGIVYCWDSRQKIPLDVGEFIQRRKKMQHTGKITAMTWCPWQSKLLASGDSEGTIHLWNINASSPHSNSVVPGKLELDSPVSSLHFSPHCKELLSTHGSKNSTQTTDVSTWPRTTVANSIAVHSYPTLRHVSTLSVTDKPIGTCVLTANGTKIVLAIPEDNKLNVCDVWAKRKELKKQPSFLSTSTIR